MTDREIARLKVGIEIGPSLKAFVRLSEACDGDEAKIAEALNAAAEMVESDSPSETASGKERQPDGYVWIEGKKCPFEFNEDKLLVLEPIPMKGGVS